MSTFERVAQWNNKAGKPAPTKGDDSRNVILNNQLDRIQEELDEARAWVNRGGVANPELAHKLATATDEEREREMLDASVDMQVTLDGFAYLLNVSDYSGAINAVLNNNDLKLFSADNIQGAFALMAELNELSGEEHVIISAFDGEELTDEQLAILQDEPTLDDLADAGATFSVHRVRDDKICKSPDHPKVDLSPFV
jgi:hypothetical protein